MSADQANQSILAIALVIESSLTVAQDWPRPVFDYCTQLIRRLSEAHPNSKLRLGFVGYGTADTVPTPITCKRFFMENANLYKEMFEHPTNLGIGTTNSGGSRGMAALEGIVATLELFDIIPTLQNAKNYNCHIIHIASASADNTQYPSWNDTMLLDDVNWESLPNEIKQRNITYNILALRPLQGRIPELHAALNNGAGVSIPWFVMKAQYTLYAARLVAMQALKTPTSAKRQSDAPAIVERSPENKRPRLSSGNSNNIKTESPKPTPKPAPAQPAQSVQPPPPPQPQTQPPPQSLTPQQQRQPTPAQPPPAPVSAPAPPPPVVQPPVPVPPPQTQPTAPHGGLTLPSGINLPPGFNYQQVIAKLKEAQDTLSKMHSGIMLARAQGRNEEADKMQQDFTVKKDVHEKMKMAFMHQLKKMGLVPGANQPAQAAQPPKDIAPPPFGLNSGASASSVGVMPSGGPGSGLSAVPDIMSAAQMQHARTLSNAGGFPQTTPTMNSASVPIPVQGSGGPPSINLQMQKMLEQQARARMPGGNILGLPVGGPGAGITIGGGSGGGMPNQNVGVGVNQPSQFGNGGDFGMGGAGGNLPGPSQMPQQPPPQQNLGPGQMFIWSGSLNWSGTSPTRDKMDVRAMVMATTTNPPHAQPRTWPQHMVIVPAREQFGLKELEMWIQKHSPAVCLFRPQQGVPDSQLNDSHYKSLLQLLEAKKIYATAAWTTPNGGQTRNILFFPHPTAGCLAGAVFPLTGLPDFPRPLPPNPAASQTPGNVPPQVLSQLQALSPEQRAKFVQQMLRQRQQTLAQQQQQMQGQSNMQSMPNTGNINMNAVMSMMNAQNQGQGRPMMGMNPQGAMGGMPINQGGGVPGGNPGVSYEMFQSFMQRNAGDNGMNMGGPKS